MNKWEQRRIEEKAMDPKNVELMKTLLDMTEEDIGYSNGLHKVEIVKNKFDNGRHSLTLEFVSGHPEDLTVIFERMMALLHGDEEASKATKSELNVLMAVIKDPRDDLGDLPSF